ncbi:hypothetical protein, partial [Mesorhizobium sp. M1322]|uniref:hypothetical protein n=1 Tax=Mesorhizobium sp. M1322 TaxID=2957081 RepID=UPI00333CC5CC
HAHPLGILDTRRMKLVRRSAAPTKPLGAAADSTGGKVLPMYPVQSVTHLSTGHRQGDEGQHKPEAIGRRQMPPLFDQEEQGRWL